ncbi:MAG: hypothetical protein ACI8XO_001133 [Verrucomicrobiales bacterium]|jgi:hypothetical protein
MALEFTHTSNKNADRRTSVIPAITFKWLTIALVTCIALLGTLGTFALRAPQDALGLMALFHLDRELNLVTLFSAALLLTSGYLVYLLVKAGDSGRAIIGLAFLFAFMGFDEMLKIHETSEKLTGVDWQILYSPIILFAGAGWLLLFLRSAGVTRTLWVGGAACWVASQLLEAGQWGWGSDVETANYDSLMVCEELLEMTGSMLFLLTLFRLLLPQGLRMRPRSESTALK